MLLTKCNIEFKEKVYNETHSIGFVNFMFTSPIKFKVFPKEWYQAPKKQMEIIADEVLKWDGYSKQSSYFSTIKDNADFIQYVFTSLNYDTSMMIDNRPKKCLCYTVRKNQRKYRMLVNRNKSVRDKFISRYYNHDGYCYCFTVPSGMLVLRRENCINITSNSGKSTYILQSCINEAIDNGYPSFIFSGELTKSQIKNWTLSQLAGRNHVIEKDNGENKPKTYKVTTDAKKRIESFYNDKLYIYDSYLLTSPEKLISRMEYMRKKNGIRNFIIDNMMILDLDFHKFGGSELNAQKDLIMQFLKFATRYDSIVHLVAHSRKPNGFSLGDEYEVLGSSSIVNLAHRIFSMRRVTKKEQNDGCLYDAYLTILKDRMLGVSKKSIALYYDNTTRRLYGNKDDKNKKYSWDDGTIDYSNYDFCGGILVSQRKEVSIYE
jgi:hypothetical protein